MTSTSTRSAAVGSTSTAERFCRRFSLAEIQLATEDFSKEREIGVGGFGKVYKGVIEDGDRPVIVAIKRLESNSSGQGKMEFLREIKTLTTLRHSNVVPLIGYCSEQDEMILVYEYIANRTLAYHLHGGSRNTLTFIERITICIGAGRGLHYLHTGSSIIHRDVKSTNILLDENLVAKVSDFGLAKHLSEEISQSIVSSSIKGSRGYLDPYILKSGEQTMESDIYAFAVVLLEALSERPALDCSLPKKEQLLAEWAQDKFRKGKAKQIVASNLKGKVSEDSINTLVAVAIKCLDPQPEKRPSMTQVLAQLELALDLQLQHERKRPTHHQPRWRFNGFTKTKVIPSAIQEDELESRQNNRVLPTAVPAIKLVELKEITNNFSLECLVGNGSSGGSVFHGVLKTGQYHAAIKRLNKNLPDPEFLALVSMVSSLKHENVVNLLGYCLDGNMQVLAYEFSPQGSLHDALHGRQYSEGLTLEPDKSLSWVQRIESAVGAAKGLHYIHEIELVHRNIKSSNVLLFDDEIAKITDFGVSPGDEPYSFSLSSGCYHQPPECGCSGQSQKGDIYSFGVVILELLTGRKPVDPRLPEGVHLVTWAKPMLSEDKVQAIVDTRLKRDYPLKAIARMAEIASLCLEEEAISRPDMKTVLRYLQTASWEMKNYMKKRRQQSLRTEMSGLHSNILPDSRTIGEEVPEEATPMEKND